MPSTTNPALCWVHEATRFDIDRAATDLGRWFEAKVQERTGGKKPKPKYDPMNLLGVIKKDDRVVRDNRTGRVVGNPMNIVNAARSGGNAVAGLGIVARGANDNAGKQ